MEQTRQAQVVVPPQEHGLAEAALLRSKGDGRCVPDNNLMSILGLRNTVDKSVTG